MSTPLALEALLIRLRGELAPTAALALKRQVPATATRWQAPDFRLRGEDELVAERELEPRESVALELPDALPRQAELLADRLERRRLRLEAEAQLDDPALPLGQIRDRALDALAADRLDRFLGGIDRRLVGEEIAELGVAVRAKALVRGRRSRPASRASMTCSSFSRVACASSSGEASRPSFAWSSADARVELDPALLYVHRGCGSSSTGSRPARWQA